MADAIQDILSLTQAFGQFANSVTQLHNTRVQVETAAKSAIINKANYDFMQRFNLRHDDPNRISLDPGDTNYWRDALTEYEGQVETHLGSIRNKNVQNSVRQNLAASSQDFALKLSNVVAQAEIQQTQEQFIAGYDAYIAAGDYHKALSFAEAGNKYGLFSPAQWAQIEQERINPAKAAILWQDKIAGVTGIRQSVSTGEDVTDMTPSQMVDYAAPTTSKVIETRGNDFDAQREAVLKATDDRNVRSLLNERIAANEKVFLKDIEEYIKIQKDNESKYGGTPGFEENLWKAYRANVHNMTSNQNTAMHDMLKRWGGDSVENALELEFTSYIGAYGRGLTKETAQVLKARLAAFGAVHVEKHGGTVPDSYRGKLNGMIDQIDSWVRTGDGAGDELVNGLGAEMLLAYRTMTAEGSPHGYYDVQAMLNGFVDRVFDEHGPEKALSFMKLVRQLDGELAGNDRYQNINRYFTGGMTESTFVQNASIALVNRLGRGDADLLLRVGKKWNDRNSMNNQERAAAMLVTDAMIAFGKYAKQSGFAEMDNAKKTNILNGYIADRMAFKDEANKQLVMGVIGNRREMAGFMSRADNAEFSLAEEASLANFYYDMVDYTVEYKIKPLQADGLIPTEMLRLISLKGMKPNDLMFADAEGFLYDVYPSNNGTIEIRKSQAKYTGTQPDLNAVKWSNPLVGKSQGPSPDAFTQEEISFALARRKSRKTGPNR
jgi:hypothetical protein